MKSFMAFFILLACCSCKENTPIHLLNDIKPELDGQWVNMVVEIPSGSIEKWEVNKKTGLIERDSIDGKPRTINYLSYPGNYGFIPQTILPKSQGGDGDPLDILAIGGTVARGNVIKVKVIGVLKLKDNGEQDDKLIAIVENSSLINVSSIKELEEHYPGILKIIETWFTNYKGPGVMASDGFGEVEEALNILRISLESF